MYKNYKMFFNYVYLLFRLIFNKSNRNKFIFIFILGFVSRVFVNNVYNVNVFLDYLNQVSVLYYLFFSLFIIIAHEFIDYFSINFIPSFSFISGMYKIIINIVGFIVRVFISMNIRIFYYKPEDINISSIPSVKRGFEYLNTLFNRNKVVMHINEYNPSNTSYSGSQSSNPGYDEESDDNLKSVNEYKECMAEEVENIQRSLTSHTQSLNSLMDILKKPVIYQNPVDQEVLRTELRTIDSDILASLDKIYKYESYIKYLDSNYEMPFSSQQPDFKTRWLEGK